MIVSTRRIISTAVGRNIPLKTESSILVFNLPKIQKPTIQCGGKKQYYFELKTQLSMTAI